MVAKMRRELRSLLSTQMVQKEMEFGELKKAYEFEAYHDVLRVRAHDREASRQILERLRHSEESEQVDAEYKKFLLLILTHQESVVPDKKRKENEVACQCDDDCYGEEENDPQYVAFLKCLTEHEKSYILKYEKNGLPVIIKYEAVGSDEEFDPEPRRKLSVAKQKVEPANLSTGVRNQYKRDSQPTETKKLSGKILWSKAKINDVENASLYENCYSGLRNRLRSAMKQKFESSNCIPGLQNPSKHDLPSTGKTKNLIRRKSRNKVKCERVQNEKCTTNEMVLDSDYTSFWQNSGVINGSYVFTYGDLRVVYENSDEEHTRAKENHNNEYVPDVQILDRASFYNAMNKNRINVGPTKTSEFRQRLITVLKKPYDKEEHDTLWQDIELHKPMERHLDLRNGRERSCPRNVDGKSYLDYHPDLKRKLSRCKDDKLKCLNLLRGFFFWLENSPWDPMFLPWQDEECLAIKPTTS